MHTGWVRVQLPPFQDGEVLVALSVAFNAGVLESITLTDARPEFGANWGEWSEARERLRAESIGTWLTSKGFPAGKYPWGVVGWGYDAKGGSGSAVVRYAT